MQYIQLIRLEIYLENAVCKMLGICSDVSDFAANDIVTLIARLMGPKWGPPGADGTQVGPM